MPQHYIWTLYTPAVTYAIHILYNVFGMLFGDFPTIYLCLGKTPHQNEAEAKTQSTDLSHTDQILSSYMSLLHIHTAYYSVLK